MTDEYQGKIRTKSFKIITCSCYFFDWKKIKEEEDESWKSDDIEKGKKCFRKVFMSKWIQFHCCHACFEKAVILNPFVLDEDAQSGFCIVKKFLNALSIDEICNACLLFFMSNYENEFNVV